MIVFIVTIILVFGWIVIGGSIYISEADNIEYDIPNPGKRALVCLISGPIAWFFHIIIFWFIPAGEVFYEAFIEWLKKD